MIKKIYFLIVAMIFIILPNSVKASTISSSDIITSAISTTYKSGFYSFDNKTNVDIGITLLNDTPTKIIVLDNEMNIEFLTRVPYRDKFYLRNIEPGKILGIVGQGEVAITFEPCK
ncbi:MULTISPECIES: hypothetical protein [Clostridium]|uniref:hypothetical protein n=1 Tax=Clostridium TaxID=1485 RepID=UPI000414B059|nr:MULTISPECIES: hypothetical protein [Clostridium]MDB2125978.1 hypothetical protein [Clostridium paraputrificum]MDU1586378.1 hypothetical protein [Clostridium sp.]MDU1980214.1 hypothetical protein [Clostridium sp.]MDU1995727.1 hypothetical protein [Clostridium sp.]MDU6050201.1 hypothetical protein [Clostridium sp.]